MVDRSALLPACLALFIQMYNSYFLMYCVKVYGKERRSGRSGSARMTSAGNLEIPDFGLHIYIREEKKCCTVIFYFRVNIP